MNLQTETIAEEKCLEIITKLRAAIQFEMQHQYINAIGKTGDFASFVKKQARFALKFFPSSNKWKSTLSLIDRYAYLDLSSRINITKKIFTNIEELEDFYKTEIDTKHQADDKYQKQQLLKSFNKKKEEEIVIDPNVDISELKVQFIKGVGPQLAAKLNHLGIFTAEDLINYLPRDHISYSEVSPIKELEYEEDVTIMGFIHKITAFKSPRKNLVILNIIIKDSSGTIKVTKYFQGNSSHFYLKQHKGQYPEGSFVIAVGKVKKDKFSKQKTLANAAIEIISEDFTESERNSQIHTAKIVPIYPLTEGVSLMVLRKLIHKTLNSCKNNLKEFLPEEIVKANKLISYVEAIEEIHFPSSMEKKTQAATRLLFNEFFLLQLRFMQLRHQHKTKQGGIKFNCFENGLVDRFIESLPFELTDAQKKVFFQEILPDMVSKEPMHRLLQGDVGSGKTIVAFLTLLVAIADGYQGAIMVPTEILAEQHYKKFLEWVQNMGESLKIRVGLLIGKQKTKERREVLAAIKDGTVNLVVGTHALIQSGVDFKKLGLIVIDEQHRFGVKQREELARKVLTNSQIDNQIHLVDKDFELHELSDQEINENALYREEDGNEHINASIEKLFMTATPIPRTLALAMHGDLDMSEIDEMPKGRKPVKTKVISKKREANELIKTELDKANQAYIVFPLIDESEALAAKAATVEYEKLQKGFFKNYRLGLIHGKLKDLEKESIMNDFRDKKIDILVSTTVIEVGVDVPDATVILIESAERFGLAQLHQLRGRVGRSDKQSYCLLSSSSNSENNRTRLGIMEKTNNGFIVAQEDLKLRGAGDIVGLKQSGIAESALQGLIDQEDILKTARELAKKLIAENPCLEGFEILQKKISKSYDNAHLNAG